MNDEDLQDLLYLLGQFEASQIDADIIVQASIETVINTIIDMLIK